MNIGESEASTYAKVSSAYAAALRECDDEDFILVFGSFPVVAGVLEYLDDDSAKGALQPNA